MARKFSEAQIVRELMRRGLVPISGGGPCTPLGTSTPTLGLCLPASGEQPWDAAVNGNFTAIDALFTGAQLLRVANGGTGLNASGVSNGQLLIGNVSLNGFSLAALSAGSGIAITNSPGGIQIAASGAPGGGSIAAAGDLAGSMSGVDYTTTSNTFVDVDSVNLKTLVTVPAAAKFLMVWVSLTVGPSTVTDGGGHVQVLAAGSGVAVGCFADNGSVNPVATYTLVGTVTNPTPGSQSIALQFRGDGTHAFTLRNQVLEGTTVTGPQTGIRMNWLVTN